jgi:hypothetical protein
MADLDMKVAEVYADLPMLTQAYSKVKEQNLDCFDSDNKEKGQFKDWHKMGWFEWKGEFDSQGLPNGRCIRMAGYYMDIACFKDGQLHGKQLQIHSSGDIYLSNKQFGHLVGKIRVLRGEGPEEMISYDKPSHY